MASVAERRYLEEILSLINKNIRVSTSAGKSYTGILSAVDYKTLSICLSNVKGEKGKQIFKLVIPGRVVDELEGIEKPFELKTLAERLERLFPRMVKLFEEAGVIVVMDKIRVSERGIMEGTGPAAERVKRVYDEFIKEKTATP